MINDPIEDWLYKFIEKAPSWEDTDEWAEQIAKLLALLRLYKKFHSRAEQIGIWLSEDSNVGNHLKQDARTVNQKALEIVK